MKKKRIVILSEINDTSTNIVMNWCKTKGYDVRRINHDDRKLQIHISENYVNVITSFDSLFYTIISNEKLLITCKKLCLYN